MQGSLSHQALALCHQFVEQLPQYDFTRCVRPNGTAYGTGGRCRKGTESALEEPKKRGRPKKVRKPLSEMSPAEKREELERRVREIVRDLRKGDPEKLRADWVAKHNGGKTPSKFPSSLSMAKDLAAKRVKEELGLTTTKKKEAKPKTLEERMQDALRRENEARKAGDDEGARKAMREHMALVKQMEEADSKAKKPALGTNIKKIDSLYSELAKLKQKNLPSGEMWRVEQLEEEIKKANRQALDEATKLGRGKKAAIDKVDDAIFAGVAKSRTQDELNSMISRLQYDYMTVKDSPEEKETARKIERQLEMLADRVQDSSLRAMYQENIGRITGKIKLSKPGSLKETLKAGQSFLQKYDEGLRSTTSILRRAALLEQALRERSRQLNEGPRDSGWGKQKVEVSAAIMRVAKRRADAQLKLQEKMKEIRKELIGSTTLSERDVDRLMNRVFVLSPQGSPKLTKAEVAESRKQIEEFARMFNGKGLTQVLNGDSISVRVESLTIDSGKRAFADTRTGHIQSRGTPRILFHEIGHIVEVQRPWLAEHAARWRDTKAFSLEKAQSDVVSQQLVGGGNVPPVPYKLEKLPTTKQEVPVYSLNDMLPLKGKGYEQNEVAVVDRFINPYMGKRYPYNSTEVVSMALEHFSDPLLMAELYRNHPDVFRLAVGLATTP